MELINSCNSMYIYIVMVIYADVFCSFTMPPGYLLVPTLGYHPPPGVTELLG